MKRSAYYIKATFFFCILNFCACGIVGAADIQAEVNIEDSSVYVGEPFTLTVRVSGSDQPQQPDLSGLKDFSVQYLGGSQNNSTSITIINGKMTRNISRGYVFSFQLTPLKSGTLTIPSLTIQADSQLVRTRPVRINASEPEETEDVKLRISLSKDECYVGEPVTFTVTWYLRQDVRSLDFMIPLLSKTDWFYFIDPDINQNPGKKYYRIPLADGEVIAEEGRATIAGSTYSTIAFSKILIPRKSGDLVIHPATVACEILTGYRRTGRRSFPADDFFSGFFNNDFFGGRQGVYQKVVAPSNSLNLKIRELPDQGRPSGFAGHIGPYTISAEATPTTVNVGDPITLTIVLSGPEYLEHVSLPPLAAQDQLTKDFKIPQERAVGEIRNNTKVFTQTLRALRPDVTQIPPIKLPYFDTRTGTYKIAETKPIPITVNKTRVVTAMDAEGRTLPAINGSEVQTWEKGIAYNYEDLSALKNQWTGFRLLQAPAWLAGLSLPMILYLIMLILTVIIRKKHANPQAARSKKAFSVLCNDLKKISKSDTDPLKTDRILDALRHYLGARLRMSSQAIVFTDVERILRDKGLSGEALNDLKTIFEACEAGRYAGAGGTTDPSTLSAKTLEAAKKLEKLIK